MSFKEVSVTQAQRAIAAGEAVGIDVRELDEWSAGHAPDVLFNPMSAFDFSQVPADKPVVLICRSGNRSGRVAEVLSQTHSDISNMTGGMLAWAEAGLPIETD